MITTDVYPGKDLGALELTITDDMIQHYVNGLDDLAISDVIQAAAFFNWANRLMLSLGEPAAAAPA